jgi:hypothetical protein
VNEKRRTEKYRSKQVKSKNESKSGVSPEGYLKKQNQRQPLAGNPKY